MSIAAILALGFALGMRHATDADHVVAVSAIVSRERTLRAAASVGVLWGIGHTVTIVAVGSAVIWFGVVITPHVGLSLELCVALMLLFLGGWSIRNALVDASVAAHHHTPRDPNGRGSRAPRSLKPLVIGIVHGLAGSAAIALLVLGTIHSAAWAVCYLLVYGLGTVAGMLLVTVVMALPLAATARSFQRLHRSLGLVTGLAGIIFGFFLVYQVGFEHGLFTANPRWTPH